MSNFVSRFFSKETIYGKSQEDLNEILEVLRDEHLDILRQAHGLTPMTRSALIDALYEKITKGFRSNLLTWESEELKSFQEFYNGIIDYSNDYVYLHLKKFVQLGYIYLFTENEGQLFHFQIPQILCEQFEELLRTS